MATEYMINIKDADLMQMVYEQDVDLGYNWQQFNTPLKQAKDVDGNPLKNASYNGTGSDFFIDGETGEQVPVGGKPSPVTQTNHLQTTRLMDNQQFHFDDCLGFLENASPDYQNQKLLAQNNTLANQQYGSFSNLSTNLQRSTDQVSAAQSPSSTFINDRISSKRLLRQSQNPQTQGLNQQVTSFGSSTYEYGRNGCPNGGLSPYKPNIHQPSTQYSSAYSSTSSVLSAVLSSDEGMQMDVSVTSPVKKDPAFPFDNYNNYNYGGHLEQSPSSLGGRNPSLTSLPEPGQSFFDFSAKQEQRNFLSELAPVDNSVSTYAKNSNACLNPNFPPYTPPPLRSPPHSNMTYETTDRLLNASLRKVGEQNESDSGISLDHSPKGFSYLSSCGHEDCYSNGRDYQCANQAAGFHLQEIKPYSLNASNGSTDVARQHDKNRKIEKEPLTRESRDEKKARELSLPFTLNEIILTPVEDYNEMLARTHLTSAQLSLIKDIRRRGKNKVAAQNCRKRKIETITIMEEDVDMLRHRRQQLADEQKDLESRQQHMKCQYNALYQMVFNSLRDDSGRPYDPSRFRLEQVDGSLMIVPQSSSGKDCRDSYFLSNPNSLAPSVDFSKIKIESF